MTTSYFIADGDGLRPDASARSPWSADMLHGRLLGGLAARAIEHDFAEPGWRISRLTVDLFRPAGMQPVQIETSAVRQGRRVRVVDALLRCDGHDVGRVTGLLLATSEEPAGEIWRPESSSWPDPRSLPAMTADSDSAESDPWLFRVVQGGFGTAEQSRVWTKETQALVEGEELTPLVRAAISGDIACPLANSSDQGLFYINADYTLLLARYPVGEWVGIEVSDQRQADGLSIASATLVDEQGPFATSHGASLARPALE